MAPAAGVENAVVLVRELRAQGYTGSYTILKSYLQPLRLRRAVTATVRFETTPGEQAQVDFGRFPFLTAAGQRQWLWGFVMVLAWSRSLYLEFIRRADVATFLRGHLHAFEVFGGVPRSCLYDRTKVVVLGQGPDGPPPRLRAPRRLRCATVPTVPRPDEGPRGERDQVRPR